MLLAMLAGGCTVVKPLYDRSMADAPHAACALVNAPAQAAGPQSAQCFAFAVLEADGRRSGWTGGTIEPGRALLAIHRAGPGCGGTFTHLTVDGSTTGPGRLELATWDLHGRAGQQRIVRWSAPFVNRSLVLADIGSTLMNPAGARISVQEGAFEPKAVCFKSY